MNIHTLYAVQVATVEAVDGLFDQIVSFNLDTGLENFIEGADGNIDPMYVAVKSQEPRMRFTTTALVTSLDLCGINGLKISSDEDDDGLEAWFQKADEGGVRATGSNHIKLTVNEGILVPRQISASHNERAELEYELIITWDGTNDPIVIATSQALEGTAAVGELFTIGEVDINGVTLEGIKEITVDFGITEFVEGADGNVWPTYTAIKERQPLITILTNEAVALSTFGIAGVAQGATDSLIYFRKVDEGGKRVADVTEEHISIAIDEGIIQCKEISGDHNEKLGTSIEIRPTYDASNAIMVFDTTAAIA